MKKIKVIRIINRLNLGGPTYNATFLTRYMSDEFETVLLAGMKDESEASSTFILDEHDVEAVFIPDMHRSLHPIKDWKAFWHIYKIIKKEKPDIVHTHASKAGFLGRFVAWVCGVPVIIHTFHGHVFHSYFGKMKTRLFLFLERWLAKKSATVIALSPMQKRELIEDFQICEDENMTIVNLGFDLKKFQADYDAKRSGFRQKYRIAEDEIAIGIIGRLVPIKNHHLFIDAIEEVKKRTNKKIKAVIVGDGELRSELTEYVKEKGLDFAEFDKEEKDATVVFTSWIKKIDWVNAGLDIVALSSFNEGTPVSLIEAQASGNPIVSTKVGGIEDIVKEGETALLSDLDQPNDFIDHLNELVDNEDLRTQMSGNGKHVLEQFSYERLCKDMEKLYKRELAKKN